MTSETANAAIIFDFDDTLLPNSTTALVEAMGVDPTEFWTETVAAKIAAGWNPTAAWMNEIARNSHAGGQFDGVNKESLIEHGTALSSAVFSGVEGMAADLRLYASQYEINLSIFVVSSGLREVITACSPVGNVINDVYGSSFVYDQDGRAVAIDRAHTAAAKTRSIFEISKGISSNDQATSARTISRRTGESIIPIENMIYLGDGLVDSRTFSFIREHGGQAISLVSNEPALGALTLVKDDHVDPVAVDPVAKPDFRAGNSLRRWIEAAIENVGETESVLQAA